MTNTGEFRRVRFFGALLGDDVHRPGPRPADPALAGAAVKRLLDRGVAMLGGGVALFVIGIGMQVQFDPEGGSLEALPMIGALMAGLALIPYGLIGLGRWRPRVRAAQNGPWRAGIALLGESGRKNGARLSVRYDEGDLDSLTTNTPVAFPLPGNVMTGEQRVWINGTGDAVTVMFEYGPFLVAARRVR
ncbi:hypothetical protein SAMN05421504_109188 [Amycolatopsis xylanica]|uniref:Transmembrane protein n=1 Tax=Amycolatopsis xylanica TaxID=589385 RepID=A0A1H3Q9Z5_9PSEU|nr:hypothetical protein [Amycolatopsis xylanica]SDZ09898.1 hypothetical protein SAMN05421504_109188 [Amycolatopsis xylanica]